MAGTGTFVNEFADEFPAITRAGSGASGRRRTDVDVALEQLVEAGTVPSKALRVIDYTVDADGNPVDDKTAATRAGARVQALRKRGYTKADGWKLASVAGSLWAQYFGPGGVPEKAKAETNGAATA